MRTKAMSKGRILLGTMLALLMAAGTAEAHKVRLFASVEGKTIQGYGYFSAKVRARNCLVEVLGPAGERLGQVRTDGAGEFSFETFKKIDHLLVLTTGDGHEARFLVRAEELPADLPGVEGRAKVQVKEESPSTVEAGPRASEGSGPDVAEAVSRAVAKELAPLQEQIRALRQDLDQYQAKVRFSDAVGGGGFILGLAGLAFFLTAKRKDGR